MPAHTSSLSERFRAEKEKTKTKLIVFLFFFEEMKEEPLMRGALSLPSVCQVSQAPCKVRKLVNKNKKNTLA